MKRYILIIAIASWLSSMGQSCPDITNNSTDPANPSDWRGNDPVINPFINLDPNMIDARFDWTSSIQEWFKPSGNPGFPSCPVASPFLETSHKQNVDHLYHSIPALQDNKAADGWELITFGFGKDKLGLVQSNFSHPRIVLYNKHTGILRVFYYLREPNFTSEYDAITIKLSFMGSDGDKESANFNHMEEVARPIDLYRKGQHEQVPNKLYTGLDPQSPCSGTWLHADFPMAYDPCVCKYDYKRMQVIIMATDEASITLTGDMTTKPITKTANSSPPDGTTNFGDAYKTGFKEVTSLATQAKTYWDKTSGFAGFVATLGGKKVLDSRKQLFIGEGLKLAQGEIRKTNRLVIVK